MLPVTAPGLPATLGVPCVTAGAPVVLVPGCEAGCVPVVPGCVVVPGWDCVVDVPVCVPIPGLGVTVPVFCAMAMLPASANTDDANKIFRIETRSFYLIDINARFAAALSSRKEFIDSFKMWLIMGCHICCKGMPQAGRCVAEPWTNAVVCFYSRRVPYTKMRVSTVS